MPSRTIVGRGLGVVFQQPASEVSTGLAELVSFEPVKNLFQLDGTVNKARRFQNSFGKWIAIVNSHLFEVSEEFPTAVFLLLHCDMQASYSGKRVIRGGVVIQEVFDSQRGQSLDWVLLDISRPFVAEWDQGLEFGSLWREWVEDMINALLVLAAP